MEKRELRDAMEKRELHSKRERARGRRLRERELGDGSVSEIKRELEMGLCDGYIARILALHHQVISHLQMEKELVTERDGERA